MRDRFQFVTVVRVKPCEQCKTLTKNDRFCSLRCFAIKSNAEKPRRPPRQRHLCDNCTTPTLNKQYCSRQCASAGRRATERAPRPPRVPTNECLVCGALTANAKYCGRACTAKAQIKPADWHLKMRQESRARANLRRKKPVVAYVLSAAERGALLARQNGLCALCQEREARVVDHCHATGQVRGLLCHKCNMGLGALGDSVQGLQRGIRYLSQHKEDSV